MEESSRLLIVAFTSFGIELECVSVFAHKVEKVF